VVIGDEHVAKLGWCLANKFLPPASSGAGITTSSTCWTSCQERARPGETAAEDDSICRELGRPAFARWCGKRGGRDAARLLDDDRKRIVTLYVFSQEHWKHLRTSNSVESPFEVIGLRTTAAKTLQEGGPRNSDHLEDPAHRPNTVSGDSMRQSRWLKSAEGATHFNGVRCCRVTRRRPAALVYAAVVRTHEQSRIAYIIVIPICWLLFSRLRETSDLVKLLLLLMSYFLYSSWGLGFLGILCWVRC